MPIHRFVYRILACVPFTIFVILAACTGSYAQSPSDRFGKNRIQTKPFAWTYYKTDNFEIYFYKEGSEIARFAALHAEEEYKRISKAIGYAPFGKTKLLLYNSHTDLLQSNIGLDDEMAFVGGQTNFIKLNAELAFNGNLIEYKNDISTAIARIYITDLIYGGNIREVYQNGILVNLPDWFISGAAAYVGRGWSQEMDDYMRDAVYKYRLRNPAKFRGKDAELLGQSIFNFMAEKYGEPQIANIISLSRIMRNDREAIEATLNVRYRLFIKEWKQYYKNMAEKTLEDYKMPTKRSRIKKHNYRKMDYHKIKISPNGNFVAYTQNKTGRYAVKLTKIGSTKEVKVEPPTPVEEPKISDIDRELGIVDDSVPHPETKGLTPLPEKEEITKFGRKRTVKRGGTNLVGQKVNFNIPLIAWKNNNHLAVMVKKKNRHILKTYNTRGIRRSKIKIYNFNQILDFSYSHDDNFIVISAERNGQSDIFVYDTRRATTKVITNDMYDDLYPIYQKGTKNLIWSSNRHNDTLGVDAGRFRLLGSNLNLFRYEPENSTTVLTRLTNFSSNEIKPLSYNSQYITYLSDATGIENTYKLDLQDSLFSSTHITDNAQSYRDYDISVTKKSIAYVAVEQGKERLHYESLKLNNDFDLPKTARLEHIERLLQLEEEKVARNRQEAIKVVEEKLKTEQESQKLETLVEAIMKGTMSDSAIASLAKDTTVNVLNLDSVQTQTFVFESEKNTLRNTEGAVYRNDLGIKSDKYYLYKSDFQAFASKGGLWQARHRLGVENTVTSLVFDPLRGFGAVLNATLTDMFNDHRFYGGVYGSRDLRTSNIYLEYQYLKKRIDFKFRFEKQRLYVFNESTREPHKYTLNRWEIEASLPFTNAFRISFIPYYMNNHFVLAFPMGTSPFIPDALTHYFGYRAEAVYDNTLIVGNNMQEGTKFKLLYEYSYAMETVEGKFQRAELQDFGRVSLDLRRYQRVHQELILATRLAGGAFLGPAKKNFLLGGMDNWVGANTANTGDPQSPMYIDYNIERRDWLFNKYVTNLRGFSYNQQYGNNFILFNAEVRWPIIKYFYRGVIGSNFLKNFQLSTFYDLGTAWTGTSPWDKENNFNTRFIDQSQRNFTATVINYRNPWLQGFGGGMRTMLLGYYVKVDLAWGVMDYVVLKPRWYVTLGYDF